MKAPVTLVLIDTESHVLANNAIEQSTRQFDFAEVLVFTDRTELWPRHRTVRIAPIRSIEDYNRIAISEVPQQLRTDFFVLAQFDGFVLDGSAFREEFYRFDYIGAVWPHFPHFRVGNGGFCWRSRRLAEAVAGMAGFRREGEPEDVFIARIARVALEMRHGCVFADEATASRFSSEFFVSGQPTFGFHGLFHLPMVYRDSLEFLVEHLSERVVRRQAAQLLPAIEQLSAQAGLQFRRRLQALAATAAA